LLLILGAYYLLRGGVSSTPISTSVPGAPAVVSTGVPKWGHPSKTTGCKVNSAFQDTSCTPGDTLPNVTKADICKSGYASSVRNVPESEKNQVYAEYGIASHTTGQYEVDHLISLELGGSNEISNLFPEAASPVPGFHEKDKVENYLHGQVCSGAISLQAAQLLIATNWIDAYQQMGGVIPASSQPTTNAAPKATVACTATTGTGGGCCKVCSSSSQACGDSCISLKYTCHKPAGCACK
jgi:hypothetical protein